MATTSFGVGDRVRARTSGFVPAGTFGTVEQVLVTAPGMYDVHFDGFVQSHLMHRRDLERADDLPPPDRERTAAAG
jgi:hypothetical protein